MTQHLPAQRGQTEVDQAAPAGLRRQWLSLGVAGLALLAAAHRWWGPAAAVPAHWPWLAGSVWLYLWWFTGRNLRLHRPDPGGPVAERLGPGNLLTLARGWLIAALAGCLLAPPADGLAAWLPMAWYTLADVFDYFDGYLARKSRQQSALGEALDLELDALGVFAAVNLAIGYGRLPAIFLTVGLARYAFAVLIWIRQRAGLRVQPLSPSGLRRPLAGLTMGFISVTLWPIFDRPELALAGWIFFTPFMAGFVRDALVVSDSLDPRSAAYLRWRSRLRKIVLRLMPVILRLAIAGFALAQAPRYLAGSPELVRGLGSLGLVPAPAVSTFFGGLVVLTGTAMLLGYAARFAAFVMLFPLGLTIAAVGLDPWRAVGLTATLGILIAGSGRYSIWSPSEKLFANRAGEHGQPRST